MNKTPSGTGGCCSPTTDGITYIKLGPNKRVAGMRNLDKIFPELYQENHHPDDISDETLVKMARQYNYISPKTKIESEYAVALRKAYKGYLVNQEEKHKQEAE